MNNNRKYDLEERLVKFSVLIISLVESLPDNLPGKYLAGQITRSGLSPALNYGEAKSAESTNDFIHKMKVSLKELRETYVSLLIIKEKPLTKKMELLQSCLIECNELISIFVKSIQTAEKHRNNK
ncbi:MAG: four helix bundle protein [Bacteroidetes bacterium]|nr:four helix bundle protein [Bacteroidota bacterium]